MKIKKHYFNKSDWINNFFEFDQHIYFTQELREGINSNCLFKIKKDILISSFKDKILANSNFLANPLLDINIASFSSNIEIEKCFEHYIQNIVKIEDKTYISFIIKDQVITCAFIDLSIYYNLQIIAYIDKHLLVVKDNKNYLVNSNLNIVNKITLDKIIVNLINTQHGYVIHTIDENIGLYDKNFKLIKWIEESNYYKKVFYINKNNILISDFKNNVTYIKNIVTQDKDIFIDEPILRGLLLNKDLFLAKIKNNNICFIY